MWLHGRWRPSPHDAGSWLLDLTALEGAVGLNVIRLQSVALPGRP